jgi:hypothetical protein
VAKKFQKLILLLLLNNPMTNLIFVTEHRLCRRDDLLLFMGSSNSFSPSNSNGIYIAGQMFSINFVFQSSWVQCQLLPVIISILTMT